MAAFAVPGVEADMVVIAAGRNERRTGAHALHHLKPEYAAVKPERAIEIGGLEMDMPDPRTGNDGWVLGHVMSPVVVACLARLQGEFTAKVVRNPREGTAYPETVRFRTQRSVYARSDTSPAGSSNSNVFSVIDTMVS